MFTRVRSQLPLFMVAMFTLILAFSSRITSMPWPLLILLNVLTVAAAAMIAATLIAAVAIALVSAPLRPIAESSIVGKHTTALGRLLIRLLAFFGNTTLAWLVGLSIAFQSSAQADLETMPRRLWEILLAIAAVAVYAYWLWIVGDVLRMRRTGRRRALARIARAWSSSVTDQSSIRVLFRAGVWLVDDAFGLLAVSATAPLLFSAVVAAFCADLFGWGTIPA